MTQVFNDCLGKTKQQMFDYCVANNVDIETVFKIGEQAEDQIPILEQELRELENDYVYDNSTGGWYAPPQVRCKSSELECTIDELKSLQSNAEEVYSMLDDYYYERQLQRRQEVLKYADILFFNQKDTRVALFGYDEAIETAEIIVEARDKYIKEGKL